MLDPTADVGAFVYESRSGPNDRKPLYLVLNKDGKLVHRDNAFNADNSSTGIAWAPANDEQAAAVRGILERRSQTEIGSAERKAVDSELADTVRGFQAADTAPQTNAAPATAPEVAPTISPAAPVTTPEVTSAQQAEVPVAESARQSPSPAPAANPAAAEVTAPGLAVEVPAAGQSAAPQVDRRAQATERVVQAITKADPGLAKHVQTLIDNGDLNVFTDMADAVALVAKNEKISVEQATGLLQRAMQKNSVADPNKVQGFEFNGRNYHQVDAFENNPVGMTLHEATHARQRAEHDQLALDLLNSRTDYRKPVALRALLETTVSSMARVNMAQTDANGKLTNGREALTYLVEEAASWGRQQGFSAVDGKFLSAIDKMSPQLGKIIRDMVAGIRAYGIKHGLKRYMNPTVDDLVALAKANVRDFAKYGALPKTQVDKRPMASVSQTGDLVTRAKEFFGTTSRPEETGYILPDGTRLDLSGRHYATGYEKVGGKYQPVAGQPDYLSGGRNVDHRELVDLTGQGGTDGMRQFMRETGAMRYLPGNGISVETMPTPRQIAAAVKDFRQGDGFMYVDVGGESKVFPRPTVDAVTQFISESLGKPQLSVAAVPTWARDLDLRDNDTVTKDGRSYQIRLGATAARVTDMVTGKQTTWSRDEVRSGVENGTLEKFREPQLSVEGEEVPQEHPRGGYDEPRVTKTGKVIGAPTGKESVADRNGLVRRIVNLLAHPDTMWEQSHKWYEQSGAEVAKLTHGDRNLIERTVRLMALYSQGNSLGGNTTATIKSMMQIARGDARILAGRFPNVTADRIQALLSAKEINQSIPGINDKVVNFYRNLIDPATGENRFPNASTQDRWMMRALGYNFADDNEAGGSSSLSPTQYAYAHDIMMRAAKIMSERTGETILPRQIQAAVWTNGINVLEHEAYDARKKELQAQAKAFANSPAELKKVNEKIKAMGDDFVPTNMTFVDYLTRATAQVTYETIPGKDTGILPGIHDAPLEQREEYTRAAREVLLDKDGNDELMQRVGVTPLYANQPGSGTFEKQMSPNMITGVVLPGGASPDTATANRYASAVGYLYDQKATPWHRPDPTASGKNAKFGVSVTFDTPANAELSQRLADHMATAFPEADYTKVGNEYRFLNFSGLKDAVFESRLRGALESFPEPGSYEASRFKAETNYITRDQYEGHLADSETGRSDLQNWLDGRRTALQAVQKAFAEKYGWDKPAGKAAAQEVAPSQGSQESPDAPQFSVAQTETPAFRNWFRKSPVTDSGKPGGTPLRVYHGTTRNITAFSNKIVNRQNYGGAVRDAHFFNDNPQVANSYAGRETSGDLMSSTFAKGSNVMPVYLSMQNPLTIDAKGWDWDAVPYKGKNRSMAELLAIAKSAGHDGIIIKNVLDMRDIGAHGAEFDQTAKPSTDYVVFSPTQIKSATGNSGAFDPQNPDIRFSISGGTPSQPAAPKGMPKWLEKMPANVQEVARKGGGWVQEPTFRERWKSLSHEAGLKLMQGGLDQFRSVLDKIGEYPYMLLRMASSSSQALESAIRYGQVKLNDAGALEIDQSKKSFLAIMKPLGEEYDRFFQWMVGNRASELMAKGLEHNLDDGDIEVLKSLNKAQYAGDTWKGEGTREQAYLKAAKELSDFNNSVLDVAEKAGIITPTHYAIVDEKGNDVGYASTLQAAKDAAKSGQTIEMRGRGSWASSWYVPFYRLAEEGQKQLPSNPSGMVNQQGIKRLKGGPQVLNDIMGNLAGNWAHLLDASLRNQAAAKTLEIAEQKGVAHKVADLKADRREAGYVPDELAPDKNSVFVLKNGKKVHYVIDNALVFDSLSALSQKQFGGPVMKSMNNFKRLLTWGVTISPTFRIRNTIRDQMQAMAANPTSYNLFSNMMNGFKYSSKDNPEYANMLAGGGLIRFGTNLGDERGAHAKLLLDEGIKDALVLDSPKKISNALKQMYDAWQATGERSEDITRANLYHENYERFVKAGESPDMAHLKASFIARDSMDFSLHGNAASIRMLTQVVPFMGARLQGLYKLGRAANADPKRFAAVLGGVTLATLALAFAYRDDEEWKKRSIWDRDNFWAFRIGDTMYRIPKPFEIGALATVIERGVEAIAGGLKPTDRELFWQSLWENVGNQLSMNPVPQAVAPMIQLWGNKSWFTGSQIESQHDLNLKTTERRNARTSATAIALSKAMNILPDQLTLSPEQIDFLVQSYLGWAGAHAVMTADMALRPAMGLTPKPAMKLDDWPVVGDFAKELPASNSRYVSQFYDHLKGVQEAMGTIRALQEQGRTEEARKFADEHQQERNLHTMYSHTQSQISKFNQQLRKVQTDPNLSAEERRDRIDQITQRKLAAAQRAEESRARLIDR